MRMPSGKKRNWQPREMMMLSEYMQTAYANYPYQMRVRLGSYPDQLTVQKHSLAEERIAGVWRRWADAIVFKHDEIVIIEASIRVSPGKISMLKLYESLFKKTPEMSPYYNNPLKLELVYAIEDHVVMQLARDAGIRTVHFKPAWLTEYLQLLYPSERRAPLVNMSDLEKEG